MSRAFTTVLVGVTLPVSEIWLPFKNNHISLSGHDYSPWSWKNSIDRNWLKKFMQVGVDVLCIHTCFGGRDPSSFGDMATYQNGQISLSGHGLYSPWSWKIQSIGIGSKNLCK